MDTIDTVLTTKPNLSSDNHIIHADAVGKKSIRVGISRYMTCSSYDKKIPRR